MNKFGMVLGLAAVATLAGCKDPSFKSSRTNPSQNAVTDIGTTKPVAAPLTTSTTTTSAPISIEPITVEPVANAKKCTCAPGTKHSEPCKCGAADCKCIVETKPVVVADLSSPSEPETTVYIVQNGDYLAKISKKFNVTISSIKRLNPSIKGDIVRVGQKLKLPGKIDVGVQTEPVKAAAKTAKKVYTPYTGATKEYVVKNGDTLGALAYGNGIGLRQLKELNGLTSDTLKIGQKLKIPAEKVSKVDQVKPVVAQKTSATVVKKDVKPVVEKPVETTTAAVDAGAAKIETPVETTTAAAEAGEPKTEDRAGEKTVEKPAASAANTYLVQEGDDMTGVSIRWGVSAAAIRDLNGLAEGDQLVPGQTIKLPADAQQ